jgi:uroporphyrinogen-III synthase
LYSLARLPRLTPYIKLWDLSKWPRCIRIKGLEPVYYPILYSPAAVKTYSTDTNLYEELGLVFISSQHTVWNFVRRFHWKIKKGNFWTGILKWEFTWNQ